MSQRDKNKNYRLKEIFQTPDHVPFGGLNVMFVGDLMQLPPVKMSLVFKRPGFDLKLGAAFDNLELLKGKCGQI